MTAESDGLLVLIAEDSDDDFEFIDLALTKCPGPKTRHVRGRDGRDVMNYLDESLAGREARPDLILLDGRMPGMGGLDTLQLMEKRPELRDIPVVVMTNSGSAEEVRMFYRHGANCCLRKPMDWCDLLVVAEELKSFWFSRAMIPNPRVKALAALHSAG